MREEEQSDPSDASDKEENRVGEGEKEKVNTWDFNNVNATSTLMKSFAKNDHKLTSNNG